MKRKLSLVVMALLFVAVSYGQKFKVVQGSVHFLSKAPLEDIEALCEAPAGLINMLNNEFAFIVPINKFEFENKTMKEHFNEKYLHSDKFPKAIFSGILSKIDMNSTAWQNITATGKMTIHGVSQNIKLPGKLKITGTHIEVVCDFKVKLVDYNIVVPEVVGQNIAEVIAVTTKFELEKQ